MGAIRDTSVCVIGEEAGAGLWDRHHARRRSRDPVAGQKKIYIRSVLGTAKCPSRKLVI